MDIVNNIISHIQIVILTSLVVLGTSFAFAEDPPIHVEADKMTSTEKNNSVVFTGEVDAKQGDVRIRSDVMTVYYTPKEKNSKKNEKEEGRKNSLPASGKTCLYW